MSRGLKGLLLLFSDTHTPEYEMWGNEVIFAPL
jgi:hypothetical protein